MEVASSLAAFLVGGLLGLVGRKLSIHFRGYRLPARAIERLRDRSLQEEAIVEGIRKDPLIGRAFVHDGQEPSHPLTLQS